MRRSPAVIPAAVLAAMLAAPAAAPGATGDCAPLLERIASGRPAAGEPLHRPAGLAAFYEGRACRAAWLREGVPLPAAEQVLAAVRGADRDGLRPQRYHLAPIERLVRLGVPSMELDLLLTDAFLDLAAHLAGGAVDPASLGEEWNIARPALDSVALLRRALDEGRVGEALAGLAPATPGYRGLRDELARLRAVAAAGGWPAVPPGPALRPGDRGPRVAALRDRLAASGELAPGAPGEAAAFDGGLADALRAFQLTHGLEPDAIAGRRTIASLNEPASRRALQAAVNLERLRWLPPDLGPRRLVVNIADFSLEVFEGGAKVLGMKVIAGRQARRTPFFSGEITSVVLNPTWTIPRRIALEDELPKILEDRDWLVENDVRVYRREGEGWSETLPGEVQWVTLGPGRFPYRLVQQPGPRNALGRIKFQIPNPYDIYLHDTPSRELFELSERTFSSGCIRVQRPLELAELLLAPDPLWTRGAIEAGIAEGVTRKVPLAGPMPVFILYWTAWVDRSGVLQLREDVYGLDTPLGTALGITPENP